MNQAGRYYKHSGAFGPLGLVYMIVAGGLGALVLGVVYGYAILYIPFIYLNVFMIAGFGAAVGYLVHLGAKAGKVRNSPILLTLGFAMGLVALYVGWVVWIFAFSGRTALALSPIGIVQVMAIVAEEGAWGIFGWTPKGVALYALWACEAVIIVGASTMFSWKTLGHTPFCERCNQWIQEKLSIPPLQYAEDADALKRQLEQGEFALLGSLERLDAAGPEYTQVELLACPTCRDNHLLTVKSVRITVNSKNKAETKETVVVENLMLTPEHHEMLVQHWQSHEPLGEPVTDAVDVAES